MVYFVFLSDEMVVALNIENNKQRKSTTKILRK
jgi:hypothetical protein